MSAAHLLIIVALVLGIVSIIDAPRSRIEAGIAIVLLAIALLI